MMQTLLEFTSEPVKEKVEEKKNLSERQMIWDLRGAFGENYFKVTNVAWGFFGNREADLLIISKNLYLTEVEIKISLADLKKDKDKPHRRLNDAGEVNWQDQRIAALYYAIPRALWYKIMDKNPIPADAGIIVVNDVSRPEIVRRAKRNKTARRLTIQEALCLARLGSIKFWSEFYENQKTILRGQKNGSSNFGK